VDSLIGDSGMSKEEFIKNLIMTYGINSESNNYAEHLKGYDAYEQKTLIKFLKMYWIKLIV
ncbi:hypothetical protein C1144_13920, partial [Clostridium botulinum]